MNRMKRNGELLLLSMHYGVSEQSAYTKISNLMWRAGPDAQNTKEVQLERVKAQFFSSVLHLRGDQIAVQPYEREGNILCWNGEASRTTTLLQE